MTKTREDGGEGLDMKNVNREVQVIEATRLLGERGMLRIDLNGELYTLRLTRNGRLILTK